MGFSYQILADTFHVEKTTIRYLCRRFGLASNIHTLVKRIDIRTTTKKIEPVYTEENINPGKSYAQYIQDEKNRKQSASR